MGFVFKKRKTKELQAETQRSRLGAWSRVASRLQRAGVGTAVMSSSGVGSHAPLVALWFCGGSVGLWIFCGGVCFVGLQVWSFWPWRPQDQWVKFGFGSLAVRLCHGFLVREKLR
ncbi:hypothetical protein FCV25MIE_08394 [Fagus crenata]